MLFLEGDQRPSSGATGGASGGGEPVLEQVARQMERMNVKVLRVPE
jgi:hypothetical protein